MSRVMNDASADLARGTGLIDFLFLKIIYCNKIVRVSW